MCLSMLDWECLFSGRDMNMASCDAHAFANTPIGWHEDKNVASCNAHAFANSPINLHKTPETPISWPETPISWPETPISWPETPISWHETPKANIFKVEVPGMKKEDMKVQVLERKTLGISRERKKEELQKADTWFCVERAHGNFLQRFRLPANNDVDKVQAQLGDGVLMVTIHKVEKPKP